MLDQQFTTAKEAYLQGSLEESFNIYESLFKELLNVLEEAMKDKFSPASCHKRLTEIYSSLIKLDMACKGFNQYIRNPSDIFQSLSHEQRNKYEKFDRERFLLFARLKEIMGNVLSDEAQYYLPINKEVAIKSYDSAISIYAQLDKEHPKIEPIKKRKIELDLYFDEVQLKGETLSRSTKKVKFDPSIGQVGTNDVPANSYYEMFTYKNDKLVFFKRVSQTDDNNNNNAADIMNTPTKSQLLSIFLSAVKKLSESKSSIEVMGWILASIADYHFDIIKSNSLTSNSNNAESKSDELSEPFDNVKTYLNQACLNKHNRITSLQILSNRPVMRLTYDLYYKADSLYNNKHAKKQFSDFLSHEYEGCTLKEHAEKDSSLQQDIILTKPSSNTSGIISSELELYAIELEYALDGYPEVLDQFLLRLCKYIGDKYNPENKDHQKLPKYIINCAEIFKKTRADMDEILVAPQQDAVKSSELVK